jgi:hypothetical protein
MVEDQSVCDRGSVVIVCDGVVVVDVAFVYVLSVPLSGAAGNSLAW